MPTYSRKQAQDASEPTNWGGYSSTEYERTRRLKAALANSLEDKPATTASPDSLSRKQYYFHDGFQHPLGQPILQEAQEFSKETKVSVIKIIETPPTTSNKDRFHEKSAEYDRQKELRDEFVALSRERDRIIQEGKDKIADAKSRLQTEIHSSAESLSTVPKNAAESITEGVERGKQKAIDVAEKVQEQATNLASNAAETAGKILATAQDKTSEVIESTKEIVSDVKEVTKDFAVSVADGIKGAADNIMDSAQAAYKEAASIGQTIGEEIQAASKSALDSAKDIAGEAGKKLGELQDKVEDGLATTRKYVDEKGTEALEKSRKLVDNGNNTIIDATEAMKEKRITEKAAQQINQTESWTESSIASGMKDEITLFVRQKETAGEFEGDTQKLELHDNSEVPTIFESIAQSVMDGVHAVADTASLAIDKVKDTLSLALLDDSVPDSGDDLFGERLRETLNEDHDRKLRLQIHEEESVFKAKRD